MEKSMISSYSKNLMCMPERTQNLKRIQAISVLQQSIPIRCCQKSEAKITRSRKKKEGNYSEPLSKNRQGLIHDSTPNRFKTRNAMLDSSADI